ncbi:MAG TPA: hypothetical protein DEA96_11265 [Leptospiraceae bacterium]|nr:hypothetical protein [Spirochaetaceae bacterium]HBS05539.1 hypothetical protein [Leptospiraceae bacterium]|tara:strand:+ start:12518 stop:13186 length:669 start_codon:yes stop_codon:yes gene_type:complete
MILKKVDLKPFLETVVEDDRLHVRWLETLSLLENMGARKIHKSMSRFPLHLQRSEVVLQHAAEEARHAFFFKKQIHRLASQEAGSVEDPARENQSPLCQWEGIRYFQSLDGLCKRRSLELLPGNSQLQTLFSYLAVTYVIEERAVDVYGIYEGLLRERDLPIHLSGLLKEEEGHMKEILNMASELPLDFQAELERIAETEGQYFQRFAEKLSQTALTVAVAG